MPRLFAVRVPRPVVPLVGFPIVLVPVIVLVTVVAALVLSWFGPVSGVASSPLRSRGSLEPRWKKLFREETLSDPVPIPGTVS